MSHKYIFDEDEIICNFLGCAAGMGIAGRGQCFLDGEANIKECKQFILDEDFQKDNSQGE